MGFFKKKNKQITFIENAGGMIITKSIYEGTSKLKWFFREESVNPSDNGWRAIGDNDTQEYLNNPENSIVVDFNTLANIVRSKRDCCVVIIQNDFINSNFIIINSTIDVDISCGIQFISVYTFQRLL